MMEEPLSLAETFLAHASVRVEVPKEPAEFESLLRDAWEKARKPWPQLVVSAHDFVRQLAQRMRKAWEGKPLEQLLKGLKLSDLYVVCAYALEVRGAIEVLDAHFLAKLLAALKYLKLPEAELDDVCQSVRIHVLMGTPKGGSPLADYAGEGPLLNWLRAIAVRLAGKRGVAAREMPMENLLKVLESVSTTGLEPELDFIKQRYRPEFQRAFNEAFSAIPSESRYLLRLYLVNRLPMTRLAELFEVNQSTISRRLQDARDALYEETKRLLKERFDLSSREFKSLMDVLKSQLDVSFSQLLKEENKEGEKGEEDEQEKKKKGKKVEKKKKGGEGKKDEEDRH